MNGRAKELAKEEEEQERNKVKEFDKKLRLITGGKEPPSTSNCWLDDMAVGSCFLVKRKNDPFEENLGLFRIDKRTEKSVIMNSPLTPMRLYYDPVAFCNKWRLFEDLGVMIDEQEINDDGNRIKLDGGATEDKME